MDMKRFYEDIFNPNFLVRYGYYDLTKVKTRNQIVISEYGLADSFYSGIFNMNCFADYLLYEKGFDNLKSDIEGSNDNDFIDTEPVYFNIPKGEYERRQYKMPNLYSYMRLLLFIYEEKDMFINEFMENKYSISKYFGQGDVKFKTTQEIKQGLLYGGIRKLNVDLANFYHTLYTHSIQWMLLGKKEAKKRNKNIFADNLDRAVRNCQYGETYGIPTGNLLSRLIAELYMCFFDKKMDEEGLSYSRYVDDFVFSYTFEEEKIKFLRFFSFICRENNLILKEEKTYTEKFPVEDKNDKTRIFEFFDKMDSLIDCNKWKDRIYDFTNFCISQEGLGNKGAVKAIYPVLENVLKYTKLPEEKIKKIFYTRNEITNFNLFEYLLDISLKDSRLTNRFLHFSGVLLELGGKAKEPYSIVKKYFKKYKESIRHKLNFYVKNNYNQEFYQILLYMVIFDVKNILLKKDILDFLDLKIDDYSLILLVIMYLKNKKIKSRKELLAVVDSLLKNIHNDYPKSKSKMTEKLWLFRYFIYYILNNKIIDSKEVKLYCRNKGYKSNKNGYKTELNWKNALDSSKKVDKFFRDMLENNVWLVYCGENNNFEYSLA